MNTNFMSLVGVTALSNPLWMALINPYLQFGVAILGAVLLIFMILIKYTEWKLNMKKLKE